MNLPPPTRWRGNPQKRQQAAPRDALEGGGNFSQVVNLAIEVTWLAPVDTGCGDTTENVHSFLVEADESPRFHPAQNLI